MGRRRQISTRPPKEDFWRGPTLPGTGMLFGLALMVLSGLTFKYDAMFSQINRAVSHEVCIDRVVRLVLRSSSVSAGSVSIKVNHLWFWT